VACIQFPPRETQSHNPERHVDRSRDRSYIVAWAQQWPWNVPRTTRCCVFKASRTLAPRHIELTQGLLPTSRAPKLELLLAKCIKILARRCEMCKCSLLDPLASRDHKIWSKERTIFAGARKTRGTSKRTKLSMRCHLHEPRLIEFNTITSCPHILRLPGYYNDG
jgi:hypothetical protein